MDRPSYHYIDEADALARLVERLAAAERIALDTEADSLHHYFEKVCLVQLSTREEHYIVDPLAGLDLAPLLKILAAKPLILHGADYDLRILRASFGFRAGAPVFDTMLAAQLLGYPHLGLAALVGRFFDATLIKSNQRFNWSLRPLPEEVLVYASDDTRYLERLGSLLFAELEKLGRLGWHAEACEAQVQAALSDKPKPDEDEVWRIKGAHELDRRGLAYLRALWHWRERLAREADLPPFKIFGHAAVIDLARWAAAHPHASLQEGPRLPRNINGWRLRDLGAVLRKTRQLPRTDWPQRRRRIHKVLPAETLKQINALRAAAAEMAASLGIDSSVLASRSALEAIVERRAEGVEEIRSSGRLNRWQAELLEPIVREVLSS